MSWNKDYENIFMTIYFIITTLIGQVLSEHHKKWKLENDKYPPGLTVAKSKVWKKKSISLLDAGFSSSSRVSQKITSRTSKEVMSDLALTGCFWGNGLQDHAQKPKETHDSQ